MQSYLQMTARILLTSILLIADLAAQEGQQAQTDKENAYGSEFFEQLHGIFGRFRDSDLQRVFQEAHPIQCSELVGRKGEWRPVAFFNEDRKLGDWCKQSLEEVKADLAVYTFSGDCAENHGAVQVATEFPTSADMEAYKQGQISLDLVDVMINKSVKAVPDPKTMAYTFELPYLFLISTPPQRLYSLHAPDRNATYARNVSSRWECKAVFSKDVTYRFMICRSSTIPQGIEDLGGKWKPLFGSSAFFILSDGTEARSSVSLSFDDGTRPAKKPAEAEPSPGASTRPSLKRKE